VLTGLHSPGQLSSAPPINSTGAGCVLSPCAISFASFILLLKHWHVPPIEATVGVSVISMVFYTPVHLLYLPQGRG